MNSSGSRPPHRSANGHAHSSHRSSRHDRIRHGRKRRLLQGALLATMVVGVFGAGLMLFMKGCRDDGPSVASLPAGP